MHRNIFDKSTQQLQEPFQKNITLKIMPYGALKRRELFNFLIFVPEEHSGVVGNFLLWER